MSLFVLGNPLLDITAPVDQKLLDQYGLEANNAVLASEKHMPLYKQLSEIKDHEFLAGGSALNSARVALWAAKNSSSNSTIKVGYTGSIANDAFGNEMQRCVKDEGVVGYWDVHTLDDTYKNGTGTCAVCISGNGKARSLVANLGAANDFNGAMMATEKMAAVLKETAVFYHASFFLTHDSVAHLTVAKHAAEHNKVFSLNLSAPFLLQVPVFAAKVKALLPYCDIVFGNETETDALAVAMGWKVPEGEDKYHFYAKKVVQLDKVNKKRPRISVVTHGTEPLVVATKIGESISSTEYPILKLSPSEIIDTNGAGDAFVGGFLSAITEMESSKTSIYSKSALKKAVLSGLYTAWVIIQQSSTSFPKTAPKATHLGFNMPAMTEISSSTTSSTT